MVGGHVAPGSVSSPLNRQIYKNTNAYQDAGYFRPSGTRSMATWGKKSKFNTETRWLDPG